MTFALVSFRAYGIEAEEPVNNKYRQALELSITAANTNVALDLGTYAGTFWTAVSGTEPGTTALLAIKDIQTRAKTFLGVAGSGIAGKIQGVASFASILAYDSAASLGGAATEALTVTGLLTTDTILAVTQKVKGANSTALNGYNTLIADGLTASWTGNPGANAVITVAVKRAVTAVQAGTYQIAMNGTNTQLPDITFLSGEAPTAYTVQLQWSLKDGEIPVEVSG